MHLKSIILSLVIGVSCSLSYASSDKENNGKDNRSIVPQMYSFQGGKPPLIFHNVEQNQTNMTTHFLNTPSQTVQNVFVPAPTISPYQPLRHTIAQHLMTIDIQHINHVYKSLWNNSQNHPDKTYIRKIGFNILTNRAVQEVTWINQKVMEFQTLGTIALHQHQNKYEKDFTRQMEEWQEKKEPFLIWTKNAPQANQDFDLLSQLNTLGNTYGEHLEIAQMMIQEHLASLGNPYAYPSFSTLSVEVRQSIRQKSHEIQ